MPFDLIFTDADRAAGKPREEMALALAHGRADDNRWHQRKDGSKVFCGGITTPLTGKGAAGFAKIARDFTDEQLGDQRRELALAEERAVSGRAREAAAIKDQFLAIVSHELKNPLSIIQMNAALIDRLPSSAETARSRSSRIILSAVASQAQIIDDLLDLSRVNMGKVTLAPTLFDVASAIRNIVEAVQLDADAKGLVLSADLAKAHIYADPVRVEQIVWNLLTNAIKFTPSGGTVTISLSLETHLAWISVSDSGLGLDMNRLTDIFEMFRQVEVGASRSKSGLGIGLALVKQLAELHGGGVTAESAGLGHGSRFNVWLPIAAGHMPASPKSTTPAISGLRLLLVDDEPDMLAAFGSLLESEGALVTVASGAQEALDLAFAQRFDAILSDIGMPVRDGYWLVQQLRRDPRTTEVAVLAVTGMSRDAERKRAIEAGFDALVGKPLDFDRLRVAIVEAIAARLAEMS